jgi:hypothetical protein
MSNRSEIVRSELFIWGEADEHQGQVVQIASAQEFRSAAGDLLSRRKPVPASQNGLDAVQLAE